MDIRPINLLLRTVDIERRSCVVAELNFVVSERYVLNSFSS